MNNLEVRNLCKSFGDTAAVKNLSLSISKGEKAALMGTHNSGKTTLLRLLEGLDSPDSGEILVDGKPITSHEKFGMFSQEFRLFSNMNVLENLCAAPVKLKGIRRRTAEGKAQEWLTKAGLTEKAKFMPQYLSEGQRQRAAICRSLMLEPEIMLFDDAVNAIDPNVTSEIYAMIKMLAKHDITMLVVSNDINFVKNFADRVIFLSDGQVCETGTPEDILKHPKCEKTAEFIRRLQSFSCTFDTCDFDLIELQSNLQKFAEKYGMTKNYSNRLQICVEELVYEMLFGSCRFAESIHLALEVSYSEADSAVIIDLAGKGKKFNPFEDEGEGELSKSVHLGVTILRKIAKTITYDFMDGTNYLHVSV